MWNRMLRYRIGLVLLAVGGLGAGFLLITGKSSTESVLLLILAATGIILSNANRPTRRGK